MKTQQTLLFKALQLFDHRLKENNLSCRLVLCGAFAIQLHGYDRGQFTYDIDSVLPFESEGIKEIIKKIGDDLGLGDSWLNDQAATVALPEGSLDRMIKLNSFEQIEAFILSRIDLIKMKVCAFAIRRDQTNKDWEDLVILHPSKEEIEEGIDFLIRTSPPPTNALPRILQEFEQTIQDIRSLYGKN